MINVLGLNRNRQTYSSKPVVFVSLYEHHSNLLPWRESECEVVTIGLNDRGTVSIDELQKKLLEYSGKFERKIFEMNETKNEIKKKKIVLDRPLKIGSFSAASNVTGVVSEINAITILLHRNGALAFW